MPQQNIKLSIEEIKRKLLIISLLSLDVTLAAPERLTQIHHIANIIINSPSPTVSLKNKVQIISDLATASLGNNKEALVEIKTIADQQLKTL